MNYNELVSVENILRCWRVFKKGKMKKADVMEFERHREDNIFDLHKQLENLSYCHGKYRNFNVYDPVYRVISKASVRDRLAHRVVFDELYRVFNLTFYFHSYSSRSNKGTHLAVKNLSICLRQASRNYTRNIFVLKCDIRKFFASINRGKLMEIVRTRISDFNVLRLIENIVGSFPAGLPLGNVSSQIFANIYLDGFDKFVKHNLGAKHYFRYTDDFVIIDENEAALRARLAQIEKYLQVELSILLHSRKVSIRKFRQGVDFLGYVLLPHYIIVRQKTKNRMFRKLKDKKRMFDTGLISAESLNQSIQSYLGILAHCRGWKIRCKLEALFDQKKIGWQTLDPFDHV